MKDIEKALLADDIDYAMKQLDFELLLRGKYSVDRFYIRKDKSMIVSIVFFASVNAVFRTYGKASQKNLYNIAFHRVM